MSAGWRAVRGALAERVAGSLVLGLGILWLGCGMAESAGLGAPSRVRMDFALWWSWLVSCGMGMWLGSRAIAVPLDRRSALWELAGPVSAGTWGLVRASGAAVVAVGCALLWLIAGLGLGGMPGGGAAFVWMTVLEVVLLTLLAAGLGTVFRPLGALGSCAALWFVGHLSGMWLGVIEEGGVAGLGVLLWILPDLDLLDVHGTVVRGDPVPAGRIAVATAWSIAWAGVFCVATWLRLEHRDLA